MSTRSHDDLMSPFCNRVTPDEAEAIFSSNEDADVYLDDDDTDDELTCGFVAVRNRDETISPDEDIADLEPEFDTDPDDELSGVYEHGFEAGERDARDGSKTDNPYALDTFLTSHGLWQDGYEAANGVGDLRDQD